jgi:protein gp37
VNVGVGRFRRLNSVEDLDVFKLAHELALRIYSVTKHFPKEETYSWLTKRIGQMISTIGTERKRWNDWNNWNGSVLATVTRRL